MDEKVRRRLVYAAGTLVLLSAGIHLGIGVLGIYESLAAGQGAIALPVAFLLAGLVLLALVGAYATGRIAPRPAYALGAGLMVLYLLAYADWHVLGVAESTLPLDAVGLELEHDHSHNHGDHSHDDPSAVTELVDHLRDDPIALVSKTAELVAAGILTVVAISIDE
ncbi:hypothetical protein ACYJ1Y_11360 [Natrialbaceae archaeon A-gly3]